MTTLLEIKGGKTKIIGCTTLDRFWRNFTHGGENYWRYGCKGRTWGAKRMSGYEANGDGDEDGDNQLGEF